MSQCQTAAVVVAAGMSSRMGAFKPLLPLGPSTIMGVLLHTLECAGVSRIVVVTGHRVHQLEAHIAGLPQAPMVTCVFNRAHATTKMASSVRLGLQAVRGACSQVLVCPADMPLWLPQTAQALMHSGARLAKPTFEGRSGHPLFIDASLIDAILETLDARGLSDAVKATRVPLQLVATDDPGCVMDADTPHDHEALQALYLERLGGR